MNMQSKEMLSMKISITLIMLAHLGPSLDQGIKWPAFKTKVITPSSGIFVSKNKNVKKYYMVNNFMNLYYLLVIIF